VRILILCAGEGSRWRNYTGVPKHRVVVEGEVLVERTVRQFLKYTDDIVVVANDDSDNIPGTTTYIAKKDESHAIMDKFLSSQEQWSDTKTIIVYGDVYFTDEAVELIAKNDRQWCFFLRKDGSVITGKPWGEIFALSFDASFNEEILQNLKNFSFNKKYEYLDAAAGWELLKDLLKVKNIKHIFENINSYINIDDWTEDFDFPHDFDTWKKLRLER
jgi:molybdopterin-guanine dinucleotide biosynthesis protein A